MADTLRDSLTRTRDGYEQERAWHRFLIDSYTGGGGYCGRIEISKCELGSAASVYGTVETGSYLDRYPREDNEKFRRRQAVAHYLNYVEPLTDLKVDFMLRKPFVLEGLPDALIEWAKDVDGRGTTMDLARTRAARRAALLGWFPSVIDLPSTETSGLTRAQAQAMGVQPRLVLLYPGNLTEWDAAGDRIRWAKVRTDFVERTDPYEQVRKYAWIDVWFEDRVESFEVTSESATARKTVAHEYGEVPIVICRHKEAEDDPIFGIPMHGQVSVEGRRLFNLLSELDENIRGHAFPVLVLAEEPGVDDEDPDGGDRTVGTENGLTLDPKATQKHYYLGPPADIASSFETRIENTIREMYRMARVEHVRPQGNSADTGIARKYAFAQTNAAIAAFAANIARWEQSVYVFAGRALGVPEDQLAAIRVIPPREFDVEDLDAEIQRTLSATTAKLGATAEKVLRSRLVRQLLPNIDDKTMAVIEDELQTSGTEDASYGAFALGPGQAEGVNRGADGSGGVDPAASPGVGAP